jgi:hypothetical protein
MTDPCLVKEAAASEKRCALVAQALVEVLGGDPQDVPRMGLCLSGGGWRAMTSGCALFDALSVPFKSTHSGRPVKPLDCFTHAVGLSGGSWLLFNTMAGAAYGRNPFHNTTDNPWLFGEGHRFNEAVHRYEGLCQMVKKESVDTACYRSVFRKNVGFVSTKVGADATIAAVLSSKNLGPTLVERWSNFIANDLLSWMDNNQQIPAAVEQAVDRELEAYNARERAKLEAPGVSVGDRLKGEKKLFQEQEIVRELIRRRYFNSRSTKLGSIQRAVTDGQLPFMVCCAIANKQNIPPEVLEQYERFKEESEELNEALNSEGASGDLNASGATPGRKHHPRIYDWVEFTPYYIRNPGNGIYYLSPDESQGNFANNDAPQPLFLHHYMGICGSAFACDMSCALPVGLQRTVTKNRELTSKPLIGRGTTTVGSMAGHPPVGECRDAGIDFNIPLPAMVPESNRRFDIILVMDAGSGSKNAHELQRAVDLGYLEPMVTANPEKNFPKGQFVQVYKNNVGGPTIIYFLGLCERGTHQIICDEKQVLFDVKKLRERVSKQLVPILLAEMRNTQRAKQRARQGIQPGQDQDEIAGVELIDEAQAEVDDEEDALPDDELLTDEVRTLMLAAAATGAVRSGFDAFAAAEYNILWENPLIQPQTRGQSLSIIETAALSQVLNPQAPLNVDLMPRIVLDEFKKYGVLVSNGVKRSLFAKAKSRLKNETNLVVSEPWRDYYAAQALASVVLRVDPRLQAAVHREEVPPTCLMRIGSIPLTLNNKVWVHLSNCVKNAVNRVPGTEPILQSYTAEVFQSFERFLAERTRFSEPERRAALRNFAVAMNDVGMTNDLIALLERHQLQPFEVERVAEEAARCGNQTMLQHLASKNPAFVDRPAVLACAYASGDDQLVQWLRDERRIVLNFVDACGYGYYEAALELSRVPENQNNAQAAQAVLQTGNEAIATVLFNKGNRQYRLWLAQEAMNRGYTWERLFIRAGLINPNTVSREEPKPNSTVQQKAAVVAEKATVVMDNAKEKAQAGLSKLSGIGKGLFGKK